MKNVARLFTATILIAFFTGCASTKQFVPFPNQNTVVDGTKTRIYVARPTVFGGGISMTVSDSGQLIGETGPKGYLCWDRSAGQVIINSKAENRAELLINAEPGKTYYVQQHIRMGVLYARNKLTLLNEPEGREVVSKCSPPKQ